MFGERDQRFQQVLLWDEAADFALAAAGVAREERRTVHEEELAVADARQARCETARGTAFVLGAHGSLNSLSPTRFVAGSSLGLSAD